MHIPFCDKKCYYCDFKSFGSSSESLREKYVNALGKEIKTYSENCKDKVVKTIYLGGGTPSVLNVEQINKIFDAIRTNYKVDKQAEITIEVNPESVDLSKVLAYKSVGINRVSIGLQTTDDELLKKIGRLHNYVQFLNTYNLFRNNGFDNISVDVISNLIGQSLQSYNETLKEVIKLKPEHISSYSLMIEAGSMYYHMIEAGKLKYDDSLDRAMYDMTNDMLKKSGYEHYEISNYCIDDKFSRHNMNYWELGEYRGFGISSASFVDLKRYKNTLKINDYIKYSDDSSKITEFEYELDDKKYVEEMLFLGLRKLVGIDLSEVYSLLKDEYKKELKSKIEAQINKGYLTLNGDNLKLTKLGIDFSNMCFSELLFN